MVKFVGLNEKVVCQVMLLSYWVWAKDWNRGPSLGWLHSRVHRQSTCSNWGASRSNSCTSWPTTCSNWGGLEGTDVMDIDHVEVYHIQNQDFKKAESQKNPPWTLFMDRSSTRDGSGMGIVLKSSNNTIIEQSIWLRFLRQIMKQNTRLWLWDWRKQKCLASRTWTSIMTRNWYRNSWLVNTQWKTREWKLT